MRRYMSVGLVAAAVLATGVTPSFGTARSDPLAEFYTQKVTWSPCDEGRLECAELVLPLDYKRPAAERISLVISRKKATDPARRRGILVLNPGGPGGSGLGMPRFLADTEVAEVYDLIGFDPRGVGRSTALRCRTVPDLATFDTRPADSDFPKWAAEARAAEDACQRAAGGIRPFVNTPNTARDLDVVRAALGEEKLNYLGYSYGTYLGAVYGSLFPTRLDRNVLDSAVHPEWIWREQFRAQAVALRRNVEDWAAWVAQHHDRFQLGATPQQVMAAIEQVAAALVTKPIGYQTRTTFDAAIGVGTRYRPLWSDLANSVLDLKAGKPSETSALLAGSAQNDLASGVFHTVTCEVDWPTDVETYFEDMRVFRDRYPYGFGVVRAAPTTCAFRTFTPPEPAATLKRDGYPVGLVIQAEGDTQTHYDSGPAMATRLGHNLITVLDEGKHGLYGTGNTCVDRAVNRYMVDGILPPSSSNCPGDPRPNPTQPTSPQHVQTYLNSQVLSTRP
ncbi:alpha/beta fold hydrolase [Saccharothrix sp. ALI-22-I]|uniref:alpha/beta fold hydrolase n=1 Tax=Saccharothrix sp. ALI-22-I TaxID=1933778 RepID=UPI001EE732BE|nr:alpha/beta fold hydrolase [Saccharothrix sp. ALI-22-I]